MRSSLRSSLLVPLGLGIIACNGALLSENDLASGESTLSQSCTVFAPPSTSSAATCAPLAASTVLRDLGTSEPGGGYGFTNLTVDDTSIYFTASAPGAAVPTLFRMPKTGGALQTLDDGVSGSIVLDGANLLYTRMTSHPQSGGVAFDYPYVARLNDQCGVEALQVGDGDIQSNPVVDGAGGVSWLVWPASSPATDVVRWDPATNKTTQTGQIGNDSTSVTSFVGDATSVYWSAVSNQSAATTIAAMPSVGGAARTIAALAGTFTLTDVNADSVYLVTGSYFSPGPVTVSRMTKADGSMTTVASGLPGGWGGYFAHDTNVYWANGSRVVRAPKSGGASEVVLDVGSASSVTGFALDACNVYAAVAGTSYSLWGQGLPAEPSTSPGPEGD